MGVCLRSRSRQHPSTTRISRCLLELMTAGDLCHPTARRRQPPNGATSLATSGSCARRPPTARVEPQRRDLDWLCVGSAAVLHALHLATTGRAI